MPTPDTYTGGLELVRGPHFVTVSDMVTEVARATYMEAEPWNGFLRPWFTIDEARELVHALPGAVIVTTDGHVLHDDQQGEGWQPVPERRIDGIVVYGVGAGWWAWQDVLDEILQVETRPTPETRLDAEFSAEVALRSSWVRNFRGPAPLGTNDEHDLALMLANLRWWATAHGVDFDAALEASDTTVREDADRWAS